MRSVNLRPQPLQCYTADTSEFVCGERPPFCTADGHRMAVDESRSWRNHGPAKHHTTTVTSWSVHYRRLRQVYKQIIFCVWWRGWIMIILNRNIRTCRLHGSKLHASNIDTWKSQHAVPQHQTSADRLFSVNKIRQLLISVRIVYLLNLTITSAEFYTIMEERK